jgi:hypothetical protein
MEYSLHFCPNYAECLVFPSSHFCNDHLYFLASLLSVVVAYGFCLATSRPTHYGVSPYVSHHLLNLSLRSQPNSNLNIGCMTTCDGSPEFNNRGVWSDTSLVRA